MPNSRKPYASRRRSAQTFAAGRKIPNIQEGKDDADRGDDAELPGRLEVADNVRAEAEDGRTGDDKKRY
jgi:hypothetical protein